MKFLLPISFILIAGVLFFTVTDPFFKDVSKLRADVSVYNTALDNSKELQKTLDSLVEKYRNIKQDDKDRLQNFLPNTVNNIKFILEIEHIANLHNMPIKNIKFEAQQASNPTSVNGNIVINNSADSKSYGVFPIEFTTEGNYDTFVAFLEDIEKNLRLVDVKSISFTVPPPASGRAGDLFSPNVYTYTLKVETYWLK
jgi:hypothetical protein